MIMKFVACLSSVLALSAPVVLALQPTQAAAQGQPAPAPHTLTYEQQLGLGLYCLATSTLTPRDGRRRAARAFTHIAASRLGSGGR